MEEFHATNWKNLFECWKLVFVCCCNHNDLCSRLQILCNATWIASILIKTNELRDFIVLINQLNVHLHIHVQRTHRSVLKESTPTPSHFVYYNFQLGHNSHFNQSKFI